MGEGEREKKRLIELFFSHNGVAVSIKADCHIRHCHNTTVLRINTFIVKQ